MVPCREKPWATGGLLRHDDHATVPRDWRLPDAVWARLEPLGPARQPHRLGCQRPRVEERQAMEASVGVWRTGGHWYARPNPGLCASRSAHRRVHERAAADGCRALWPPGRTASAAVPGLEWAGLARDGAMPHAPLGGATGRQASDRPRADRHPTQPPRRRRWRPPGPRRGGRPAA
jgi:Putative transposase of IS4/5 family (DUF4096)